MVHIIIFQWFCVLKEHRRYAFPPCSMVRSRTVQYGPGRCSTVRDGAVRCGKVRCSAVRYGTVRDSMVRYRTVGYSMVRSGAVWSGALILAVPLQPKSTRWTHSHFHNPFVRVTQLTCLPPQGGADSTTNWWLVEQNRPRQVKHNKYTTAAFLITAARRLHCDLFS